LALGTQGELGLENPNEEGLKWDWWDGNGGEGLQDGGTVQADDEGLMVLADSSVATSSSEFDRPLFEGDGMYLPSPPSFENVWDTAVG
jgi:hypothetical protein